MRPDLELLDAWRAGDALAGNELFERHFATVYRFFRSKFSGEVDDLVQKTFLNCAENRDGFAESSRFRSFLLTCARNVLIDHFRRLGRAKEELDPSLHSVAELADTPSKMIAARREHLLLLQALRMLAIDDQLAIELFYWEGLTAIEVGEILGKPEGTVRTRLRRARQALADKLASLDASEAMIRSTLDNLEAWAESMRRELAAST